MKRMDKALKKIRFAFFAAGISAMLMVPASAYVDPSVTSMAIQAVAGVVVAAAAVAGVLWSKAKKKAKEVLHIDENAGKIVEEDVVVDEETPAETAETPAETVGSAEVQE